MVLHGSSQATSGVRLSPRVSLSNPSVPSCTSLEPRARHSSPLARDTSRGDTPRAFDRALGSAPRRRTNPLTPVPPPSPQDVFFLLYGAVMVFFMQAGFALLEVGSGTRARPATRPAPRR